MSDQAGESRGVGRETGSDSWLILTSRYGGDPRDPSGLQLEAALREVYEQYPNDVEHPNAWLRLGYDEGPMYVIDVYLGGRVLFGQWEDPEYEDRSEPEGCIDGVSSSAALQLWTWLANGEIELLKAQPWARREPTR